METDIDQSASDLLDAIKSLIDQHGNLPIGLIDPDTGWLLPIGLDIDEYEGKKTLLIVSAYYGVPDGCVGHINT
jgi:hypothetical protein